MTASPNPYNVGLENRLSERLPFPSDRADNDVNAELETETSEGDTRHVGVAATGGCSSSDSNVPDLGKFGGDEMGVDFEEATRRRGD